MDRENVIEQFKKVVTSTDMAIPEFACVVMSKTLADDVLVVLTNQEAEIALLKEMQFRLLEDMDDQELGSAVNKMLGLRN